jgi:hypothetical protein
MRSNWLALANFGDLANFTELPNFGDYANNLTRFAQKITPKFLANAIKKGKSYRNSRHCRMLTAFPHIQKTQPKC